MNRAWLIVTCKDVTNCYLNLLYVHVNPQYEGSLVVAFLLPGFWNLMIASCSILLTKPKLWVISSLIFLPLQDYDARNQNLSHISLLYMNLRKNYEYYTVEWADINNLC